MVSVLSVYLSKNKETMENPMRPDMAVHARMIRDQQKEGGRAAYASAWAKFSEYWKKFPELSERDAWQGFAQAEYTRNRASATATNALYEIRKRHEEQMLPQSWTYDAWIRPVINGHRRRGGRDAQRRSKLASFPLTQAMVHRILTVADAVEPNGTYAAGIALAFHNLIRHNHVARIRRENVLCFDNTVEITIDGLKDEEQEGTFFTCIVRDRETMERLRSIKKAGNAELLFPNWEEKRANEIIAKVAEAERWPGNFRYHFHGLRAGGAVHLERCGASPKDVKVVGKWAPESLNYDTYRARAHAKIQAKLCVFKPAAQRNSEKEWEEECSRLNVIILMQKERIQQLERANCPRGRGTTHLAGSLSAVNARKRVREDSPPPSLNTMRLIKPPE